jgi:NTE family protein
LARLARLGILRHVQVISTVSGGSIIGALYYLHVKKLLENKTDEEIDDTDYVRITKDIERDFLEAVQCNLRMMTYCDWKTNWRMAAPDYSRSDRLGEL